GRLLQDAEGRDVPGPLLHYLKTVVSVIRGDPDRHDDLVAHAGQREGAGVAARLDDPLRAGRANGDPVGPVGPLPGEALLLRGGREVVLHRTAEDEPPLLLRPQGGQPVAPTFAVPDDLAAGQG